MPELSDFWKKEKDVSQRRKYANDERDALHSLLGKKRKTMGEQVVQYSVTVLFLPLRASVILLKLSKINWLKNEIEERRRLRNTIIKFSVGGGLIWICFSGISRQFIPGENEEKSSRKFRK